MNSIGFEIVDLHKSDYITRLSNDMKNRTDLRSLTSGSTLCKNQIIRILDYKEIKREHVHSSSWSSSFFTRGCAIADLENLPLKLLRHSDLAFCYLNLQMQQSKCRRRKKICNVFESERTHKLWETERESETFRSGPIAQIFINRLILPIKIIMTKILKLIFGTHFFDL